MYMLMVNLYTENLLENPLTATKETHKIFNEIAFAWNHRYFFLYAVIVFHLWSK